MPPFQSLSTYARFHIRFENRLQSQGTIKLLLKWPNKKFWLPSIINSRIAQSLVALSRNQGSTRATGYVKPDLQKTPSNQPPPPPPHPDRCVNGPDFERADPVLLGHGGLLAVRARRLARLARFPLRVELPQRCQRRYNTTK